MDLNDIKRKVAELEAKGDIPKAIAELDKAVQSFPTDGSLHNKLGDLYLKMNKNAEALDAYERGVVVFRDETYYPNAIALCKKILRIDKERAAVYRYLGELHKELDQKGEAATYFLEYADRKLKNNELETALEIYTKIKELAPNNPKIVTRIAEIHKLLKHEQQAETLYKEAADIYKEQGKLKEAKEVEKVAGPVAPRVEIKGKQKIEVPREEKISLETLVSPEIAKLLEEEVITTAPEVTVEEKPVEETMEETVTAVRGTVEESVTQEKAPVTEVHECVSEREEPAVAAGETEVEAPVREVMTSEKPAVEQAVVVEQIQGVDGMLELANLYCNLGNMDEAYECYRMASEEAFTNQEWDKAMAIFRKIIEFRPFDLRSRQKMIEIARYTEDKDLEVESMLELADTLLRREAKSQAVTLYKRVLSIEPENAVAKEKLAAYEEPAHEEYIDLGAILKAEVEAGGGATSSLQNIRELLSEFRKEVFESIGEGDYHSHYDLGVAYKGMGLYNEAIEEFHIAAKDRKLTLKAFEMIGACLVEKEKLDDAITIMEAGLRIPNHQPVEYFGLHYLLAQAHESKGDLNRALQYYAKAYSLDPSIKEVRVRIDGLKKQAGARKTAEAKEAKDTSVAPAKKSRITYL